MNGLIQQFVNQSSKDTRTGTLYESAQLEFGSIIGPVPAGFDLVRYAMHVYENEHYKFDTRFNDSLGIQVDIIDSRTNKQVTALAVIYRDEV